MNDNEIIKAFKCCFYYKLSDCENCPNEKTCGEIDVVNSVIDLVNRQRAEIERLKNDIEEANIIERENEIQSAKENEKNAKIFLQAIEQAKSEAIKEFAARLKSRLANLSVQTKTHGRKTMPNYVDDIANQILHDVVPKDIDNLVKEITEVI